MTIKNIPVGYKDSPLGIIPQEWEVKRLGEIGTFYGGGTPSKSIDEYWHGDIPWISSADLIENDIYWCNINRFITLEAIRNSSTQIIPQNSILIVTRVGVGKVAVAPCDLCVSQDYICLQNSGMNTIFLAYEIMQRMKNIVSQIQGTSIKGISINEVKKIQLPLPPLAEQEKIAEILSTWDKAIDKQTQLIEKLELRKKGLMQQLLTGKRRLPGFSEPWQTHKLQELFSERNETNRMDLPLLSITGDRGVILQIESEKRDTSNDDKSKYKRITKGDIGYNTMRMWQGRSALSDLEGIVSPAYTIVVPNSKVDGYYMSVLFKQPRLVYDFWTHSQGLVGDTLNCKYRDFGQVRVSCPSYIEQKAIAKVLTTADHEIELAQQKLELLRQQKRGLMQQLLTGKKRVKY